HSTVVLLLCVFAPPPATSPPPRSRCGRRARSAPAPPRPAPLERCAGWPAPPAMLFDPITVATISLTLGTSTQVPEGIRCRGVLLLRRASARPPVGVYSVLVDGV